MKRVSIAKIYSKVEDYFKNKNLFLIASVFVLVLILFMSFSFANLTPTKTVYITSQNLNYEEEEAGAFKIAKSSEWTGNSTANIKFDLNSIVSPISKKLDIILAIDTSESMAGNRLTEIKSEMNSLISYIIGLDIENKVGLVSFNSEATVLSKFTNDYSILENQINSLSTKGATDYYSAFSATEELLKEYIVDENKECIILIFTDGANSESIPNEVVKASYLKSIYPYIKINSIFYEMGDIIDEGLSSVSNETFKAKKDNLKSVLYQASVGSKKYDNFIIEDIINSTYFDIISTKQSLGKVTLTEEDGNKKISWDLSDFYISGTKEKLEIKIKLKNEYIDTGGIYQTNIQELIDTKLGEDTEKITTSLTPIISDNYTVSYLGNDPQTCTVVGVPSSKHHSVFSTVEISPTIPTCSGYKFKGWKFSDDSKITKMGDENFIMPESDVVLTAEWAKVRVEKSMEGPVLEVPLLYNIIASNSVLDNIKSDNVSSSTGIDFSLASSSSNGEGVYELASTSNDQYPVYYYRGDVDNNNVVFADFCWKVVRTTSTGGVKLIYNGPVSSDGSCSSSGTTTTIGSSGFNSNQFLSNAGYMYDDNYNIVAKDMSNWFLYDTNVKSVSLSTAIGWQYGGDVTFGLLKTYSLSDFYTYTSGSPYSVLVGKYTGRNTGYYGYNPIAYVVGVTDTNLYYVLLYDGDKGSDYVPNVPSWNFGKSISYNNGTYTLNDTYSVPINKWSSYYSAIKNTYPYTCFDTSTSCATVNHIEQANSNTAYYYALSNNNTLKNLVDEITYNSSNNKSSTIKSRIDTWYSSNLLSYDESIEDTIWCNDRRISDYGKWDTNTTSTSNLMFAATTRTKPTLTCNFNDSFTVSSSNGNKKLTYPIALLTYDEALLAGNISTEAVSTYLVNGVNYHLMTPILYNGSNAFVSYIKSNGYLSIDSTSGTYVRPAISLSHNSKVISGTGTKVNPYVIGIGNYITILGNSDITSDYILAPSGKMVTLFSLSGECSVTSFKMNGELVEGNTFIMPDASVKITDIKTIKSIVFESRDTSGGTTHSNYSNNLNETFEKEYEGAISLNVELTYQTESASFDYITLYDSPDSTTPINNKKYGGTTKTTETIVVNSNYIKINFKTDTSINSYYGFKAIITPNY